MKKHQLTIFTALTTLTLLLSGCGSASNAQEPVKPAKNAETSSVSDTEAPTESQGDGTMNHALITNGGAEIFLSALEHDTEAESAPAVYYLSDISPEAMVEIYNALQWSPTGKVAVKLSTGEPPASNYLRPGIDCGFGSACGRHDC